MISRFYKPAFVMIIFFFGIYYKRRRRENARKILFDFLENRKYNYEKRAAGKRKTSFPAARFRLLKYSIAIKKCVACQRKSSLYARSTLFCMAKRRSKSKMAESNKMKDMPVNRLMIQMGIPMILSMGIAGSL